MTLAVRFWVAWRSTSGEQVVYWYRRVGWVQ